MGLDGFSMGNLGLNAELTSAQMTTQAEQIALKEHEIKIKDVTEQAESNGVKRKEEEEQEQEEQNSFGQENEEEKNENKDENFVESEYLDENFFENKNPKDFLLRLNYKTKLIELYSRKNDRVFGTIKAQDLISIMSKLDNVSGFLVNRKI